MNTKRFFMLFAAAVGLLTACVNDELPEPAGTLSTATNVYVTDWMTFKYRNIVGVKPGAGV